MTLVTQREQQVVRLQNREIEKLEVKGRLAAQRLTFKIVEGVLSQYKKTRTFDVKLMRKRFKKAGVILAGIMLESYYLGEAQAEESLLEELEKDA